MKSIENIKNGVIDALSSIDLDKLSIYDLKTYAEIMKITAETKEADYLDTLVEKFSAVSNAQLPAAKTIADMK